MTAARVVINAPISRLKLRPIGVRASHSRNLGSLEALVRALGYDAIRLHVFGDNDIARHLYRAVGYSETDVSMIKRLA